MELEPSAKLVAKVKLTLTKRTVDALEPEDKPWIAWDDKLTGFGVRVYPSGSKVCAALSEAAVSGSTRQRGGLSSR